MILSELKLLSNVFGHFLAVTGKHYRSSHTQRFQSCNCLRTVVLHLIINDNVSRIFTIDSHMDNRSNMVTIMPLRANSIHHLGVAHTDQLSAHISPNSLTSNLFHLAHRTAIRGFVGEGIAQGRPNGMRRKMLDMSCKMEQLRV